MSLAFYSWRNSIKSFCVNPEASLICITHVTHFEMILKKAVYYSLVISFQQFLFTIISYLPTEFVVFLRKRRTEHKSVILIFLFLMQNQIHSQTVCLFPLQEIKHNLRSICSFTAEKAKNVLQDD